MASTQHVMKRVVAKFGRLKGISFGIFKEIATLTGELGLRTTN